MTFLFCFFDNDCSCVGNSFPEIALKKFLMRTTYIIFPTWHFFLGKDAFESEVQKRITTLNFHSFFLQKKAKKAYSQCQSWLTKGTQSNI